MTHTPRGRLRDPDGRMYDVANMKHVTYILERAESIARREAENRSVERGEGV